MQKLYMPTEQVVEMIEITYNIDILEEKGEELKVIKRNVPIKKLVSLYDIKNPTQMLSKKGTVLKNKCRILLKDEGEVVINKSYEQMKKLILQETPKPQAQIGFKLKNHNKNVKSSRRNQANLE
jgi:hypothetical protein